MDTTNGQHESERVRDEPVEGSGPENAETVDETVSLLDLIAVLAKHWRFIFFASFFAAVGIVLFSIYTMRMPADSPYNPLPNIYSPQAQILLTDGEGDSSVASAVGADLGFLAGLAAGSRGEGAKSAALAESLLRQNWIVNRVIEEFGLLEEFAGAAFPTTAARTFVRGGLTTEFADSTGILTVSFQHIDPIYATDILQRVVDLLEARFTDLTRDKARARTTAVQTQINQLSEDLDQARNALNSFQTRYGIVDPELQGAQTVALVAQYQIEIHKLEVERETIRAYIDDPSDPQVLRINRQIELLADLIGELNTGFRVYSPIGIPRNQIATLTTQFLDLKRDLALKEQIYSSFHAELVSAQIESQDASRRFQIIEPPEVPEIKSSPNRGVICIIVSLSAFLVSVFLAFVLEYFANARRDPRESGKLEVIRNQFRFRKKRA